MKYILILAALFLSGCSATNIEAGRNQAKQEIVNSCIYDEYFQHNGLTFSCKQLFVIEAT